MTDLKHQIGILHECNQVNFCKIAAKEKIIQVFFMQGEIISEIYSSVKSIEMIRTPVRLQRKLLWAMNARASLLWVK